MGFSQNTYSLLANAGLHCAGELLELGVGCEGPLAEEIQKRFVNILSLKLNLKRCAGGGGRFRRQARAVQIGYGLCNCKSQAHILICFN